MDSTQLTPDEQALVMSYRREKEAKKYKAVFQGRAVATALDFIVWSKKSGMGLTFSTFVSPSEFNYQGDDAQQIFEAVGRVLAAAMPAKA